jgi:hypothetical protein
MNLAFWSVTSYFILLSSVFIVTVVG